LAPGKEQPALADAGPPTSLPSYRRLYEQIRAGILSGQLAAGSRLPPSRALAVEAGVSRNTVLTAFEQLLAEGYLEGRRGSGTFVSRVLPDELLSPRTRSVASRDRRPVARRLSARGERIAAAPRVPLPSVVGMPDELPAFQIGLPALEAFPSELWSRLFSARMRRPGHELMRYGDPAGYAPLRKAIAAYLGTARGVRCTADQVIIVAGSQQALEFCARVLLDPGDPAWLEDPGYLGARAALVSAGARIVPVPVDDHGLDVAAGIAREPDARLAFVTPSHQFPLGSTMSLERRLALIDWAARTGSWVVEDDYDSEFRYVGRPLTALQGIDKHSRVVYVGTFSKVLFPALRLGYLVAPPDLVDAFTAAHLSADMHAHVLEQAVLTDFMTGGHFARHLRRMRVLYAERQTALVRDAEQLLGDSLRIRTSEGGLHLIGWLPEAQDDRAVAQRAAEYGVHVWPLSLHCLEPGLAPALLLGYAGVTPADIRAGLARLDRALRAQSTETGLSRSNTGANASSVTDTP
jgi:GntR family transcriptional regulator/MocR family aminotransferase